MHIKIYFNDKPLFLADAVTDELAPYARHDDTVLIDEFSTPGVNSMIHEMRLAKVHAGIYLHPDVEELRRTFWKKFQLVLAAGGLVTNPAGAILMMFRRGKWDLPKGKLDPGETLETCAVREVEEETGLRDVQLKDHLVTTYHTYDESGHHILKETWWYRLSVSGNQVLEPQTEEQITALEWAEPGKLQKYLDNTFPSVEDVLRAGKYI